MTTVKSFLSGAYLLFAVFLVLPGFSLAAVPAELDLDSSSQFSYGESTEPYALPKILEMEFDREPPTKGFRTLDFINLEIPDVALPFGVTASFKVVGDRVNGVLKETTGAWGSFDFDVEVFEDGILTTVVEGLSLTTGTVYTGPGTQISGSPFDPVSGLIGVVASNWEFKVFIPQVFVLELHGVLSEVSGPGTAVVPEPGTYALLGSCLAFCVLLKRRRKLTSRRG